MKYKAYLLTLLFISYQVICSENNGYIAEVIKKAGVENTYFFGHALNGYNPNSPVDLAKYNAEYFKNTLQIYLNCNIPTLEEETSKFYSLYSEELQKFPPNIIDENFIFESSVNAHVTLIQLAIHSRLNKIFIMPNKLLIPEKIIRDIAIIKIYKKQLSDSVIVVDAEELTNFFTTFNQNELSTANLQIENLHDLNDVDLTVLHHVRESRSNN